MISNDQELIQSDPTSCPQNQKGNIYFIEVISQNIIMIYQFPEFISQYKDRHPHSVKSKVKKHLNHLKVENILKTQFSQQKSNCCFSFAPVFQ